MVPTMTKDKDEKAVIRARMAKTGESYATARARLAREGATPVEPPDDSVSISHRAGQALQAAGRVHGGAGVLLASAQRDHARQPPATRWRRLGFPQLIGTTSSFASGSRVGGLA